MDAHWEHWFGSDLGHLVRHCGQHVRGFEQSDYGWPGKIHEQGRYVVAHHERHRSHRGLWELPQLRPGTGWYRLHHQSGLPGHATLCLLARQREWNGHSLDEGDHRWREWSHR